MKRAIYSLIALSLIFALAACGGSGAAESTFTVEQLQRAMVPQWHANGEPDILEHQVISAERVERESDQVWFEPAGEYIDASNAVRYKMEVRHREYYIEWHDIGDGLAEIEEIIGDFIVTVMYRDFNIVDGEPELLFVVC